MGGPRFTLVGHNAIGKVVMETGWSSSGLPELSGERRISLRALLTEQCNLSCSFCHNEGQENGSRLLEIPVGRFAEVVRELGALGQVQVKFSGGEPTMHPALGKLMSAAAGAGAAEIVVISNGTLPSVFEGLLADHSFRVSLNIPAIDGEAYRRITGGALGSVMQTAELLSSAGVPVAFNTYWPTGRPAEKIRGFIDLAGDLGCVLKILAPCHLIDPEAQEAVAWPIGEWLIAEGFSSSGQLNHVSYYAQGNSTVRVQRPWCPVYCQALAGREVTVRLTAAGMVRSCLRDGGRSFGSVLGTLPELRRALAGAVAAAGRECGAQPRAPLVGVRNRTPDRLRPGLNVA
jgi:molybdenum cofactor biosynthesis enzyme MoaA